MQDINKNAKMGLKRALKLKINNRMVINYDYK